MLRIQPAHLEQIRGLGEKAYPHECCGLLVGAAGPDGKTVESLIPARNQRTDSPANRYLIAPEFLREVEKKLRGTGQDVIGFFHSHPDVAARPSAFDRDHAWPWYSYLIVSVRKGKAGEALSWRLRDDRSAFDPERLESSGRELKASSA